jgi:heptosyltransferase-1
MSEALRVLIVRVGAMGDVLHTLPAVTALRRARPDATIDWVIDRRWEALVQGDEREAVDRAIVVDVRRWKARPFAWSTLRDFLDFRKLQGRYDFVVDVQGTLRSALIAWLSNGRGEVAGFSAPRETAAVRFYDRTFDRAGQHIVEQNCALLSRALQIPLAPVSVAIPRTAWAENWAEQEAVQRRPMAVLAPSAGWRGKQWAPARFGQLAGHLRERGFDVVVNAARKDDALAQEVVSASDGAARTVVCNVAGLIALMRRADLCVSGDSGPLHLAAALAVPVVALFGPTSPERNGPWGPGPQRVLRSPLSETTYKRLDTPDPGLESLSIGDVLGAIDDLGLRK